MIGGDEAVASAAKEEGHAFIQADGLPELRGANGDRGDDCAYVRQPWPASVSVFGLRRYEKRLDPSRALARGSWSRPRHARPISGIARHDFGVRRSALRYSDAVSFSASVSFARPLQAFG